MPFPPLVCDAIRDAITTEILRLQDDLQRQTATLNTLKSQVNEWFNDVPGADKLPPASYSAVIRQGTVLVLWVAQNQAELLLSDGTAVLCINSKHTHSECTYTLAQRNHLVKALLSATQ